MSSKDEFIIKRSDSTTDIFRKLDESITTAKTAKFIDIFNGKTFVKSDEDNKPRLSYLKAALIKQSLILEGNLTIQIMQEIEANELYAYFYDREFYSEIQPSPRMSESRDRRQRYNSDTYINYLYKCGETEIYLCFSTLVEIVDICIGVISLPSIPTFRHARTGLNLAVEFSIIEVCVEFVGLYLLHDLNGEITFQDERLFD